MELLSEFIGIIGIILEFLEVIKIWVWLELEKFIDISGNSLEFIGIIWRITGVLGVN